MSSLPVAVQISFVVLALGFVAWPFVHALLLWEGMKVLGSRGTALGPVLAAVFLTPLVVMSAEVGVGCLGNLTGLLPVVIGASGLAMLIGVVARTACYRVILDLPSRAAFGLAIGVSVLSWLYGTAMASIAVVGLWVGLATGT